MSDKNTAMEDTEDNTRGEMPRRMHSRLYSLKHVDKPTFTKYYFLLFDSFEDEVEYLKFLRSTFEFGISHAVLLLLVCVVIIYRHFLKKVTSNKISLKYAPWVVAVAVSSLTILTILSFIIGKIEKKIYAGNQSPFSKICIKYFPIEDIVTVLVVLSAGLNIVYQTRAPLKGDFLDDGALGIPLEQVILCFIGILVIPMLVGSATKWGLLASWIFSFGFLIYAELIYTGFTFPYLAIVSEILFLIFIRQLEINKIIIFEYYRKANRTAEISIENEEAERFLRMKESHEKMLNEWLIHKMLPPKVAERLRSKRTVHPEEYTDVTIFFSDIEGFTSICASVQPIDVVNLLNELYTVMDYCASLFPLYKVETIGDAYLVRF